MVHSRGRRTVSSWLRAAGVSDDWQEHDDFLQTPGRSAGRVAAELLFPAVKPIPVGHIGPYVKLAIDDAPTKRYGPKVELAGPAKPDGIRLWRHHHPTPGPSGSEFLSGHVGGTIRWLVNHPLRGCIGLPLRALRYGTNRLSRSRRGGHRQGWTHTRMTLYGVEQTAAFKTFLATDHPAGGVIRVVMVMVKRSAQLFADRPEGGAAFYCIDPDVSAETIIAAVKPSAPVLPSTSSESPSSALCRPGCGGVRPRPRRFWEPWRCRVFVCRAR